MHKEAKIALSKKIERFQSSGSLQYVAKVGNKNKDIFEINSKLTKKCNRPTSKTFLCNNKDPKSTSLSRDGEN